MDAFVRRLGEQPLEIVTRFGDGDEKIVAAQADGQRELLASDRIGYERERLWMGSLGAQVALRHVELPGENFGERALPDDPHVDENLSKPSAGLPLTGQGLVDLRSFASPRSKRSSPMRTVVFSTVSFSVKVEVAPANAAVEAPFEPGDTGPELPSVPLAVATAPGLSLGRFWSRSFASCTTCLARRSFMAIPLKPINVPGAPQRCRAPGKLLRIPFSAIRPIRGTDSVFFRHESVSLAYG